MTCPRSHSSRVREPRYEARRPGSRAWDIRPYVLPLHTYTFRRGEATVEELGEARGGSHEGRGSAVTRVAGEAVPEHGQMGRDLEQSLEGRSWHRQRRETTGGR